MSLLALAALCLGLAAAGGAVLLSFVLRGLPTPKGLAIGHGALAATGLALLILDWLAGSASAGASTVLFLAAAAGGFYLLYRDLFRGHPPRSLAIGHGLLALTALVLLLRVLLG